jgi:hypothetical protein
MSRYLLEEGHPNFFSLHLSYLQRLYVRHLRGGEFIIKLTNPELLGLHLHRLLPKPTGESLPIYSQVILWFKLCIPKIYILKF